jgi:hypothetical protein
MHIALSDRDQCCRILRSRHENAVERESLSAIDGEFAATVGAKAIEIANALLLQG